MTAEEKQIQDLRREIEKLKAELALEKRLVEESDKIIKGLIAYPYVITKGVALFIEHPERFEYKEER